MNFPTWIFSRSLNQVIRRNSSKVSTGLARFARSRIPFGTRRTVTSCLFQDGVFCEFAVFEERELPEIPFAAGRIIWRKQGVPDTLALPQRIHRVPENPSLEWSLGEALTNLYVGASRFHRGEKLSAMRLIQGYAVDRVIELAERINTSASSAGDMFAPERRYEQRQPAIAQELPAFMQGYDRSIESAQAILVFLERHFPVNKPFKQALMELFQHRRSAPAALARRSYRRNPSKFLRRFLLLR